MPLPAAAAVAVPAVASLVSGALGAFSSQSANETNIQLAREARGWQEQMYNKYQSPQAMMKQYEAAGLNPYLLGQNAGGVGQQPIGSPQVPHVQPVNYASGIDNAVNSLLQSQQVSINSEMAKADVTLKLAQAVSESYKTGGSKGVRQLFSVIGPALQNIDFDDGIFQRQALADIRQKEENSLLLKWQREFSQEYDPQRAQKEFANLDASTKSLLSQVDLNQSHIDLNSSYVKRTVSEIAKNFADAFSAKKVGEYYEVSASQMGIINDMLDLQYQDQEAEFALNAGVRSWKKQIPNRQLALDLYKGGLSSKGVQQSIQSNSWLQNFKEVTGAVGNMFKISFSGTKADINSRSYSNFNNVTPQPSYVPIQGF